MLAALDRLVREGKIRTLAASNFNAEQLGRVLRLQGPLVAFTSRNTLKEKSFTAATSGTRTSGNMPTT
jgi:aryl-alcohol dehydrogenase-like predicted oxidoreductase